MPFKIKTGSNKKTPGGRKGDPVQGNHYELLGTLGLVSFSSLNHKYIKEYKYILYKYTKDKIKTKHKFETNK